MSEQPRDGQNTNRPLDNVNRDKAQGIRRRSLTKEKIFGYAVAQLGFPVMDVELEPLQQEILLERVFDEYSRWMPIEKMDALVNVSSSINKYDLEELGAPYGKGIVDVKFVSPNDFFSPISGVFSLGIPHPISHLSPDQYELSMQYIKTARKIYSSEPDWRWTEPCLWLYSPTGYGGPFMAGYTYYADVMDPEDIPSDDHSWVKDYFLALSKIAIGEARGKFPMIPGPYGQQIRGAEMSAEGQQEKARLEDTLQHRSYNRVVPFGLVGGY
jgi:hypothetical protein